MSYGGQERRRGGPDRRAAGERIRVLLVDDHALIRVGMRSIIEREPDMDIVGEAADPRSALEAALETTPDIILMDLSLPAPGRYSFDFYCNGVLLGGRPFDAALAEGV